MAIIEGLTSTLLADTSLANMEYLRALKRWQLIQDIYSDEIITNEIVFTRNIVLPFSGKTYAGKAADAVAKIQSDFFKGADFTNVLARTINVMNGSVSIKAEDLRLGQMKEKLTLNLLMQNIKQIIFDTVTYSRSGILVSAPKAQKDKDLTVEDVRLGFGPRITTYHPWQILDWDVDERDVVKYVLLAEPTIVKSHDDLGNSEAVINYRLIYRDAATQKVFVRVLDEEQKPVSDDAVLNASGEGSTTFPFFFVGSFVNSPKINQQVMFAMAKKNAILLSYSANANQSMRQFGSPILYIAPSKELQQSFGSELETGGLVGYNVGAGGSVGFAQPEANTLATEGKAQQIEELVQMGARLVTDSASNQTAETARIQHSCDLSTLQSVIHNVSLAFTDALRLLADYMGDEFSDDVLDDNFVGLSISDDLIDSKAESTMVQAIAGGVANQIIPLVAMYNYAKDTGLIPDGMTLDEYKDELNAVGLPAESDE